MEEKKHAKLSASGAHRWLSCPRSVALEEKFPDEESEYALEGTEAHGLAEKLLMDKLDQRKLKKKLSESDLEKLSDVETYIDYCMDLYTASILKYRDTIASVEEQLDFSPWVPGGFGTGDFVLVNPEKIIIVDLKFGKGVRVNAPGNPQLRLYGLGCINEYGWIYPFETVEMHIVQPRLNHISVETMTTRELLHWGKTYVKPRALLADKNEGEFKSGDHCRFCKARAVCVARSNDMFDLIRQITNQKKEDIEEWE